jgi:hypothetical protein
MLVLPLIIIIIMFALWMISANSLGFTCLNTNLKFFHKFQEFQSMAERLFDRKILAIQSDWGGVSKTQFFFFRKVGISHHVSCPYAHQQNVLDDIRSGSTVLQCLHT